MLFVGDDRTQEGTSVNKNLNLVPEMEQPNLAEGGGATHPMQILRCAQDDKRFYGPTGTFDERVVLRNSI